MHVTITFDVLKSMTIAGVLFGLWPIFLKNSGASGLLPMLVVNSTALVIIIGAFIFSTRGHVDPYTFTAYAWMLVAGACVGFGVIDFLGGLDLATVSSQHDMYIAFVVMLLVQIAVPVIFHVIWNGTQLHWINILGLVGVPLVILALNYKPFT